MFEFKEEKRSKFCGARVGIIKTEYGEFETPLYVFAGTDAEIRTLDKKSLKEVKALVANTYHLGVRTNKIKEMEKSGGLHKYMNFKGLIMTDSGGFQVFSYGFSREHGIGKIGFFPGKSKVKTVKEENLAQITEKGVFFKDESGKKKFLGPEESIKIQEKLGADIIFAFDECTSPFHEYEYTKKSLERTNRWAKKCLKIKKSGQALYGIIQGGFFKDLREESARFINSLDFQGIAVGGPLGKDRSDMIQVLDWIQPFLEEKPELPRHMLGIGKPEDLFCGIERGMDTFDCVIPTREARHGSVYTKNRRIDLTRGSMKFKKGERIEKKCLCQTCLDFSVLELREMIKSENPRKTEVAKLLTVHNIFWFQNLMDKIRKSILEGKFKEFKKEFLKEYIRKII